MKDAQKPDHISLNTLIGRLREGRFVIPDFQHEYVVRRSLERVKEKRERILDNPEKHRQEQISKRLPEGFDELPEEEQQEIIAEAERSGGFLHPPGTPGPAGPASRIRSRFKPLDR